MKSGGFSRSPLTSSTTLGIDLHDTLSIFLAAYESPAAVLDVSRDVPVQENGPFLALRQRSTDSDLITTLRTGLETGRRRLVTKIGGRTLQWTVTTHPKAAESNSRRAILLAQDVIGDDEGPEGCDRCNPAGRPKFRPSTPSTPVLRAQDSHLAPSSSPPLSSSSNPSPLPSDQYHNHDTSSSSSSRLWLEEPRFRALATGKGVLGEVVRDFDWSTTSLGPIPTWPAELAYMFGTILHSQLPSCIIWGERGSFLYNTAYLSVLGPEKHPKALGQPGETVWPEVWPVVRESVARAGQGEDYLIEDHQILVRRPFIGDGGEAGSLEDAYFTYTLIPIYLADGTVGGVYNPVVETTTKARSERRWSGLCRLATRLASSRTTLGMISDACHVLRLLDEDIPYVAAYSVSVSRVHNSGDPESRLATTFTLQDTVGIPMGASAAPIELVVDSSGHSDRGALLDWPIDMRNVTREHAVSLHTGVGQLLLDVPLRGSVPSYPTHAATLPIMSGDELVGCLIVYIGPGQPINDSLNDFLDLLMRQLSTSASMVAGYELEGKKLEEMAALDRAKTSFFTNISHELRTPLTLILGPVRELVRSVSLSNGAVGDQLRMVERNADRLLRLINTILDFAAAEAGGMTSRFRPTYLGQFTANLASAFQSGVELAGLQFSIDISQLPSGLVVWVDQDKYEKIIYNLLSNALKYTLAGFIHVLTYIDPTSGRFVLEVRDTGVGIPKDELGRVFDKFHRVNSTRGRSIEGTGIGLTYVLELVKIHKGDVIVESEHGHGSVFRVFIPLGKDHLPPNDLAEVAPSDGPKGQVVNHKSVLGGNLESVTGPISEANFDDVIWDPLAFGSRLRARVIVVDDNEDMRQYVTSLLSKHCDVFPCEDGAIALAELRAHVKDYDLVISDDFMPNMTGPELLVVIRADETLRNIPFIIVSANAGDDARMGGLALGADDYISKPFQARELLLRAHTQLQSASIRNKLELQMEEHLRSLEESRGSFTRLCERLPVGVHRSDPDGRMSWANEKWKSTLALPKVETYQWGGAIHPDDLPAARQVYDAAMRTRTGFLNPIEFRLHAGALKDTWIDVVYDLQPEFTSDISGELVGWVGVWSDVSNLRRLQRNAVETERAHTQEAERSRELQEQFIDITCHELRNPLNAIYNSAAMLGESLAGIDGRLAALREESRVERHSSLEKIHAELQEDIDSANTIVLCARHQKRIVDDVLNVSKLSAGLVLLNHGDFSPCQEAKNTVRMFRDEVSARGVQLHFEEDQSLDALQVGVVRGDSGRFVQIIVNLISNAIKFTEAAPHPTVRVRLGATQVPEGADDGLMLGIDRQDLLPMCRTHVPCEDTSQLRLYVAVADSGLGMTEEEQSRLFQRFAQASPRTYGEFGGSGLGLYVSRMLVELHGGKITLRSQPSLGTIFCFYIVVERSTASLLSLSTPLHEYPSRTEEKVLSDMPSTTRLRVLVVEDNMVNQRILVKLLTSLGCDTSTCNDGQECVDLLVSLRKAQSTSAVGFDLVLMDLEMPVLDGLGATRQIRQLESDGVLAPALPIVAVSGNARPEWTVIAREAGMDGFVRKPYGKAELAQVVSTWRQHARI